MTRLNVGNIRHPDGTDDNITLDSSGRVGIGTNSPAEILALKSSSSAIQIDTNRSDTTYGNAEILLGSPRLDTADGSTVSGRGLLSCLGNSTSTTGIVWLQAASANLETQLTDTDLKTRQCGIRLDSGGSFEHWRNGSQRLKIDSSGNLKFDSGYGSAATAYGVRAWVCFNGNNGTVLEDGNVSSVTDNATGNYTINFSTSIVDTNYAATGSSDSSTGGHGVVFGPPATGSIVMKVFEQSGTLRDHDKVFAIIVR